MYQFSAYFQISFFLLFLCYFFRRLFHHLKLEEYTIL